MPRFRPFLIFGLLFFQTAVGFAHEKRTVGDSQWNVGFLNEPAFSGQMNAIDLQIQKKTGEPLTGLQDSLNAQVFYADEKTGLEIPLRTHASRPWAYAGYFLPERPGDYRFRIYGTIEGQPVDEVFSPGQGIESVEDTSLWRLPAPAKGQAGRLTKALKDDRT